MSTTRGPECGPTTSRTNATRAGDDLQAGLLAHLTARARGHALARARGATGKHPGVSAVLGAMQKQHRVLADDDGRAARACLVRVSPVRGHEPILVKSGDSSSSSLVHGQAERLRSASSALSSRLASQSSG
jgi:hypothetical protein